MYMSVTVTHMGLTNLFDPFFNSGLHSLLHQAAGLVIDG
ncbi:hypothetical protein CES85_4529 [Ochrobactrum quorumnocens]|uniref:Uncharacterized protein n=1 Tax=Ochrobactrum quorumnocens TaxID=271865 RepID=A0A248UAQ4_9HYPH|nr:hypothetical protein CES85_4529 [[Ochrobactrum] quorumnocens]